MAEADAEAAAAEAAHRAKSEVQRLGVRDQLLKSYLHRQAADFPFKDCACSMCGRAGMPLALHVIYKTYANVGEVTQTEKQPAFYYGYSADCVRGFFPLCTKCAPPCKKCRLPTYPPSVCRFANSLKVEIGLGVCKDHLHWSYTLGYLAGIVRKLRGELAKRVRKPRQS